MPVHDWTRVTAGTFHDFHTGWIVHLRETLNGGLLPEGYYAMAEQRAGQAIPDVLTLKTAGAEKLSSGSGGPVALAEAPPKVALTMRADENTQYALRRRTLTIRHRSGDEIVALVEIASPANKDRASAVRDFVEKAAASLGQGYHLLVVDLFPPGPHDPRGLHGAIWDWIGAGQPYEVPDGKPLTLAAYVANVLPSAFVEPLAVGVTLPDMPLFLDPEWYVNVPLEETYATAYRGVPRRWREVVEA